MKETRYVSIVGTQIISVLNPILALIEQDAKPDSITLLETTSLKSLTTAQITAQYLIDIGYYESDKINIITVSDTLESKGGLMPVHEYIETISKDGVYLIFNIAGGLNFQVAACLYCVSAPEFTILYPENTGIHRVSFAGGAISEYGKLPLPKPVDVLRLQGVKHEVVKDNDRRINKLMSLADKSHVKLPPGGKSIKIGITTFDYVWNNGNNIQFLKNLLSIDKGKRSKSANNYILQQTRNLLAFAARRTSDNELFHRTIIALTDNPAIEERLKLESKGKVKVVRNLSQLTGGHKSPVRPDTRKTEIYVTNNTKSCSGVLYLTLGRDIVPTLIAVWSHKPKKVIFFYTPADPLIQMYKKALIEHRDLLPVKEISFCECTLFGLSIYRFSDDSHEEKKRAVNITSGTKGHSAFLALFAKKNGMPVFSVKTDEQSLVQIPSGEKTGLLSPDPLSLLLLSGQNIAEKDYGVNGEALLKEKGLYEGILSFLSSIESGAKTSTMLTSGITTPKGTLSVYTAEERMEIVFSEPKEPLKWSSMKNEWFENLIGYVMLSQDAGDVRVRMRTEKGEKLPLSEIDVVARFGTVYYVISCKAGKSFGDNSTENATSEINAVASLFGRFAVPLLARFQYNGDPIIINDVFVFGFRTFSDKNKMKKLLEDAVLRLRN